MSLRSIVTLTLLIFVMHSALAISFNEFKDVTAKAVTPDFRLDAKQSVETSDSYRVVFQSALDPMVSVSISFYPDRNEFREEDVIANSQEFKWNNLRCLFSVEPEVMSCVSILLTNGRGLICYKITDFQGTMTKDDLIHSIESLELSNF